MKNTYAYYKRELMTVTKGDEKVVYLPVEFISLWMEVATRMVTYAEHDLRLCA